MKKLIAILTIACIFLIPLSAYADDSLYYYALNLSSGVLDNIMDTNIVAHDEPTSYLNTVSVYFPDGKDFDLTSVKYIRMDLVVGTLVTGQVTPQTINSDFNLKFGSSSAAPYTFNDFAKHSTSSTITTYFDTNIEWYYGTPQNYPYGFGDEYTNTVLYYTKSFSCYVPVEYFTNSRLYLNGFFSGSNGRYADDSGWGDHTIYYPIQEIFYLNFTKIYSDIDGIDTSDSSNLLNDLNSFSKPNINDIGNPINTAGSGNVGNASQIFYQITNIPIITSFMLIVISLAITSYFLYGRKT